MNIEEELQVQLYLGTCLFQELFGEKKKTKNKTWWRAEATPAAGLCLEELRQASVDYFRFNLGTEGS